jgi:hypothetical protein
LALGFVKGEDFRDEVRGSGLELFLAVGGAGGFFAAGHDGGAETGAEIIGEIIDFVAAVDFDGFTGGVDDDFTMVALAEVLGYFGHQIGFDVAVKKIG